VVIQLVGKKLAVDRNGNGRLDNEDGPPVGKGETFRVSMKIGDQRVNYPLRVIRISSSAVDIEGRGAMLGRAGNYLALLYDEDLDGRFGEEGEDTFKLAPFSVETLQRIAGCGDDPFWTQGRTPLGRVAGFEKSLFDVKVLDHGWRMNLTHYDGEAAVLSVSPTESNVDFSFLLRHAGGKQYQVVEGSGEVVLVPGSYRIDELNTTLALVYRIQPKKNITFKSRRKAVLTGVRSEFQPVVNVEAGRKEMKVGPPFELECEAVRWGEKGDQLEVEYAVLVGRGGEIYRARLYGDARSKLLYSLSLDGHEKFLNELEFAADRQMGTASRIPDYFLESEKTELVFTFTGSNMKPIERTYMLNDLPRQIHPPSSVMLRRMATANRFRQYEKTVELSLEAAARYPENALIVNDCAWYLLTIEDERYRDVNTALNLARRAVDLTGGQNGAIIDTLALALFMTGNLEEAVDYQRRAVKLTPGNSQLQDRLEQFESALAEKRKNR
jgi:tetratricopeptide (TPR) repeat protein